METIIDQAFEAIGGRQRDRAGSLRDGEELHAYHRVLGYGAWGYIFALWLLQFTIYAYVLFCIFSFGRRVPSLGKIGTAAVIMAGSLFEGATELSLTSGRLILNRCSGQLSIPYNRLLGIDPRAGWIANTLEIHFLDESGIESRTKHWVLNPEEIAAEIQGLSVRNRA